MNRKYADLLLVVAMTVGAMSLLLMPATPWWLRLPLGTLLSLVLPGYAITEALVPRCSFGGTSRILFTLTSSISACMLAGFLLHLSPWGMQPTSWALALGELTLLACVIAIGRRAMRPEQVASGPISLSSIPFTPYLRQGALIGLAVLLLAGAIVFSRQEARLRPAPEVVELWMLPGQPADAKTVRIGITTVGPVNETFKLQVQRDGYVLREWPALQLSPDQQWEETMPLEALQRGDGVIEARLYRAEEPSVVFRRVAVWAGS